mmetsp:Transcript_9851/g.13373  ORF Transcript_9851/g.13373 Transcript_9851/m.13373 type:complete len:213 (-) Transcript_9851:121-759(-)
MEDGRAWVEGARLIMIVHFLEFNSACLVLTGLLSVRIHLYRGGFVGRWGLRHGGFLRHNSRHFHSLGTLMVGTEEALAAPGAVRCAVVRCRNGIGVGGGGRGDFCSLRSRGGVGTRRGFLRLLLRVLAYGTPFDGEEEAEVVALLVATRPLLAPVVEQRRPRVVAATVGCVLSLNVPSITSYPLAGQFFFFEAGVQSVGNGTHQSTTELCTK